MPMFWSEEWLASDDGCLFNIYRFCRSLHPAVG
ncbi:hypothetical protein I656_01526 [Geobacillus sp. WSUCF1]|nr:hypothetical protein I656_01526 [Geobacillus sp. WSUCF1]